MPRFDESDDDFYGEDDDAYADLDDEADEPDDDEPTVQCSNCGFERLEIIHQCPRCGELPTREFNPTSTQPQWVYVTALILLIALVWLIFV
jgi:uncharacterized paraquat-inducible protein A